MKTQDEQKNLSVANHPQQPKESKLSPAMGGLLTKNLGEIPLKPVKWVVENYVPKGMLTLITGHGGDGKSSLLAHLVGCVTRGRCAFGFSYARPMLADVLIYNCEDAPSEVLVPRLIAAGADTSRVRLIDGATGPDGTKIPFSLLNVDQLAKEFEKRPFGVLIIDPISSTIGNAGANDNSETDIRPLLERLSQFAEANGVSVIGVKHLGKGERENAAMRTQGSVVYTSVPRMVLALAKVPDSPSRRLLARSKTNLPIIGDELSAGVSFASEQPPDAIELVYRQSPDLPADEAAIIASQMYHCTDFQPWNGDIDELVSGRPTQESRRDDRSTNKSRAAEWLRTFLKDGPKHSTACVSEGNAELGQTYGMDWWRDSVLKAIIGGTPFKPGKDWFWRLGIEVEQIEEVLKKEDGQDTLPSSIFSGSLEAQKG